MKLTAEKLRKTVAPSVMECRTTNELEPLEEIIGQERAARALKFGIDIKNRGFNIYVAGMPGTGRTTATERYLKEIAADDPVPSDWCYVSNYENQFKPKALEFPAGKGKVFVHGEYWNAKSDNPIPKGSEIRIIGVDGMVLVVKKID